MNVLLDHCLPRQLAELLVEHRVRTTGDMNWEQVLNGELLRFAADQFDVFVTIDKNLSAQQNKGALPLCVVVLDPRNTGADPVIALAPKLQRLLRQKLRKRVYRISDHDEDLSPRRKKEPTR